MGGVVVGHDTAFRRLAARYEDHHRTVSR
jgi:hypothetical protein